MTLTAGTVINNARDQHTLLSPSNAPAILAYRELSRLQRALYTEIFSRVPAFLSQRVDIALTPDIFARLTENDGVRITEDAPDVDPSSGLDLTTLIPGGWLDITPGSEFWFSGTCFDRGRFFPWEQRDMACAPAFTLRNNFLYLLGNAAAYSRYSEWRLYYTPIPAAITADNSPISLPDDSCECLSKLLAGFFLKRLVGNAEFKVTGEIMAMYMGEAMEEKKNFLSRIFRVTQRQTYRVRDVSSNRY